MVAKLLQLLTQGVASQSVILIATRGPSYFDQLLCVLNARCIIPRTTHLGAEIKSPGALFKSWRQIQVLSYVSSYESQAPKVTSQVGRVSKPY